VRQREIVDEVKTDYGVSARFACRVLQFPESTYFYRSRRQPRTALRLRLRELAASRPRYGYHRLHVLLRREGWVVNRKLVYRLYREEGLAVRTRRRRKVASQPRLALSAPTETNERWAMDFVSDELARGGRFRVFTVIDVFTRECLALHAKRSIRSKDVTAVLDGVITQRGVPAAITCDNGTEFTSKMFDEWAFLRKIQLDFIRPGKPVENAYIESFNGRLREECLSQHWFTDIDDAQAAMAAWIKDYNESRPHTSLGDLAPADYAQRLLAWGGYKVAV
jgi:putative transposase